MSSRPRSNRSPGRTDVIRWGIIGCGDVTEVKSGPALQKAERSQLVAVMRRNRTRAADYALRHGVSRWYEDAGELVLDPEVDAVYVATPPGAHLEGVRLAARAGKPVYVEKPMARSAAECDAIIQLCRDASVPLFVAYYRRALPRFLQVREWLTVGKIGALTGVTYRYAAPDHADVASAQLPWRLDARYSGGGLFLDLGSHTLDILDFLVGPLRRISGQATNTVTPVAVEDSVAMTFCTASGATGSAAWNFASATREDSIEFSGTQGRITLATFGDEPIQIETSAGIEIAHFTNPVHIQQPLIQTIVDTLLAGEGKCPSTGESARRTSAVMDTVLSTYYGGRDDAYWEREGNWPGRRSP